MKHTTTADAFTPEDFGKLVDLEVQAKSVAAKSATVFGTDKVKVNFPLWTADPSVGWYGELDEITPADGSTDEVEVTPSKTAGLTLISNELKDDSSPEVAKLAGAGLSNQIARAIDAAYLGNTTPKGPNGLLSITYSSVDTGAALANLDPFIKARYAAIAAGSELSSWIVSPATAEAVSLLKETSSSNRNLVEFVEDGLRVAGLPVLVSDQVDAATLFWGIPEAHVMYVLRKGTTVERFPAVTQDGTYVRAVSRVGIGFLNPAGVVRGYDAA